jgi:hypothetical protein
MMPHWLSHIIASLFLHQDQVFLHHQQITLLNKQQYVFGHFHPDLNLTNSVKAYYQDSHFPNRHDIPIATFRKWLSQQANGGPIWGYNAGAGDKTTAAHRNPANFNLAQSLTWLQALSQPLPKDELFNVYQQHVQHCTACLGALAKMKRLRQGLVAGILVFVAQQLWYRQVKRWQVLLMAGMGLVTSVTSMLMKLMHKYEFSHQDNN